MGYMEHIAEIRCVESYTNFGSHCTIEYLCYSTSLDSVFSEGSTVGEARQPIFLPVKNR